MCHNMISLNGVQALSQLHQVEVLGSRLIVEYAKPYHEHLAARQCSRYVNAVYFTLVEQSYQNNLIRMSFF